jgi:hypothetical protein
MGHIIPHRPLHGFSRFNIRVYAVRFFSRAIFAKPDYFSGLMLSSQNKTCDVIDP